MNEIDLYNFELRPSSKTYDMVLSVCADTADPGEYEMAATVANAVGSRLLGIERFKAEAVEKVQTCLDRLPPDSDLVEPTKKMLVALREKAGDMQAGKQTTSVSNTE